MGKIAFLFPGQGAQFVGMGRDLYDQCPTARRLFERADALLGMDLSRTCFEGPEDRLNATDVSQPAIFVHSAAMLAALSEKGPWKAAAVEAMAGLSLGEYTALYAADAMDFDAALNLVAQRGRLMQSASTLNPSGMVCLLGLDEAKANELCAEAANGQVLSPANFNCPGQIVISGHKDACERALGLADKYGTRAVPLKVAGAFHTSLMAPAAAGLADVIAAIAIRQPRSRIIANVTAEAYGPTDEIRKGLIAQLTGPVRWLQSMQRLLGEGVERFYEIGPGKVLAGLMKKIDRKADVVNVSTVEALNML